MEMNGTVLVSLFIAGCIMKTVLEFSIWLWRMVSRAASPQGRFQHKMYGARLVGIYMYNDTLMLKKAIKVGPLFINE